jgi:acetyl esterase/lipase
LIDIFSKRDLSMTQPINFARSRVPPMLLLVGDADEDVLPRNSYNLAAKLTPLGNAVTVKTYPGLAHIGIILAMADGFRSKAPVLDDTANFINSLTIKKQEACSVPPPSTLILDDDEDKMQDE